MIRCGGFGKKAGMYAFVEGCVEISVFAIANLEVEISETVKLIHNM